MISFSRNRTSTACMIDDCFIRFFTVEQKGKKNSLKNFFSERIPDHVYNTETLIQKDTAFIQRLAETRKKNGITKIHLVVPDRYVTVFHTIIPMTVFEKNNKSFQVIVESYLENLLDHHPEFSQNDMIADYDLIDQDSEGYHVHVSVTRPSDFSHIPEIFESAGFTVDHIDISSFATHRLAKQIHNQDAYGIVSIGERTTAMSIVKSGNILASTVVNVGSNDLLATLQETLEVSRSESEKIIQQYGILHTHPDKKVLGALFTTLKPIVQGIEQVQEVGTGNIYTHDFYHVQPEYFYLYGIGAGISGIAQYLGIKTNTVVRPIDIIPFEFIDEEILLQVPVELLPLYLPVMSTAIHYLLD